MPSEAAVPFTSAHQHISTSAHQHIRRLCRSGAAGARPAGPGCACSSRASADLNRSTFQLAGPECPSAGAHQRALISERSSASADWRVFAGRGLLRRASGGGVLGRATFTGSSCHALAARSACGVGVGHEVSGAEGARAWEAAAGAGLAAVGCTAGCQGASPAARGVGHEVSGAEGAGP